MSFSTPAMTGINDVGDTHAFPQKMRNSMSAMKLEKQPSVYNPWQGGMHTTNSPWQSGIHQTLAPWQTAAPVMMSPWHANMSYFHNQSDGQPVNPCHLQSALAPVDIRVSSESNMVNEKSTADKNANNVQITWNSAEELANALFPDTKESVANTQSTDAAATGADRRSKRRSEANGRSTKQESSNKILELHADALENHKRSIETLHKNTSSNLKCQNEKVEQITSSNGIHRQVLAEHKKHIVELLQARNTLNAKNQDLHEGVRSMKRTQDLSLANHKENIEALASVVRNHGKRTAEHSEALTQHKKIIEKLNTEISQLKDSSKRDKSLSTSKKTNFADVPEFKSSVNPVNLQTFLPTPLIAPRRKTFKH
jgi:hypothetical protein